MNKTLEKISNPLNFYQTPTEVEDDQTLSVEEKIKLLQNWLNDIYLRQTAESENMSSSDNTRFYVADVERLLEKYLAEQHTS